MLQIHSFTFNPYQENTYLLSDEKGDCLIIDPGMSHYQEEKIFTDYIDQNNLTPIALLNTHCHIDHVLGNHFIYEEYGLIASFHEGEVENFVSVMAYAPQMGIPYTQAPITTTFLKETDKISIGKHNLDILYVPGHSPAHLCFYSADQGFLIGGDVLFKNSIGRTDLPGGNHQQLLENIQQKVYTLPDETVIYPGHGPTTTVGHEKHHNPFVRA